MAVGAETPIMAEKGVDKAGDVGPAAPPALEGDTGFGQFCEILQAMKDSMPPEAFEQINTAMQKRHAEPPLQSLSEVLGEPVNAEQVEQFVGN